MNTHVDVKILYKLGCYFSFANSYFLSFVSKWSLWLRGSWRRILLNASSQHIKSAYKALIFIYSLHINLCIESSNQIFISSLCNSLRIKSLYHVLMSSVLNKSTSSIHQGFLSSLFIKYLYQSIFKPSSSLQNKSLYQVFV